MLATTCLQHHACKKTLARRLLQRGTCNNILARKLLQQDSCNEALATRVFQQNSFTKAFDCYSKTSLVSLMQNGCYSNTVTSILTQQNFGTETLLQQKKNVAKTIETRRRQQFLLAALHQKCCNCSVASKNVAHTML